MQSLMVNIDAAKQSLLQNPQYSESASSLNRFLGTETSNQTRQSFPGLNLQFPSQQIGYGQQMVQNLNGNDPSNVALSFPFLVYPSTLHLDQSSQQGSTASNPLHEHLQLQQMAENNSMNEQLQLKQMLHNMQPNQRFTSNLNTPPQWNNRVSETGIKRKLDQVNVNAFSKKSTEEEQSYQAVSTTSSSGTSVGVLSCTHLAAPFQNHTATTAAIKLPKENEKAMTEKDPAKKRRNERNQREQERAQRINQQIKELRSVLNEANVAYKQNKYSILVNVVDYIKELQSRSLKAEKEHKKLVNTIRLVIDPAKNDGFVHRSDSDIDMGNDTNMLRAKGLDYRLVFEQCKFPLAIAAIDGRFLLCNSQFKAVTGLDTVQIEDKTLFDFISVSETEPFFTAISSLLDERNGKSKKTAPQTERSIDHQQNLSEEDENISGDSTGDRDSYGSSGGENSGRKSESTVSSANGSDGSNNDTQSQSETPQSVSFWSTSLSRPYENLKMTVTLTRTRQGKPKFFNCTVSENAERSICPTNQTQVEEDDDALIIQ
jgi:PAS domain-containing protein